MKCWSKGDATKLLTMIAAGWGYRDCAVILGRTEKAVKQKAHELRKGKQVKRRGYTKEDIELILKLKGEGVLDADIAKQLGRTITQIRDKICSLRKSIPNLYRVPPEGYGRPQKQTASHRFRQHLSGAPSIPDHILRKPCHLITEEDHAEVQRVIAAVGQRIRMAFLRNEISPNGR